MDILVTRYNLQAVDNSNAHTSRFIYRRRSSLGKIRGKGQARKMMTGKWSGSVRAAGKFEGLYYGVRTMVGKASNRAGVHGSRTPDAKSLDNVSYSICTTTN